MLAVTTGTWGRSASAEINPHAADYIEKTLNPAPTPVPDFDKEVLIPLRVQQAEEAARAAKVAEEARQAELAREAEAARQANIAQLSQPLAPAREVQQAQALLGSIGYASPYGNCVAEPGVNNPGYGNPIDWPVTSATPWIGATALFGFNHVAVVTGIWSNGDIEVRHQNVQGGQHRYARGEFRGFR
jgi:hypothetical protein